MQFQSLRVSDVSLCEHPQDEDNFDTVGLQLATHITTSVCRILFTLNYAFLISTISENVTDTLTPIAYLFPDQVNQLGPVYYVLEL